MQIETIYSLRSKIDCVRKGIGYVIHRPWLITKVMGPWFLALACITIIYYWFISKINLTATLFGAVDVNDMVTAGLLYLALCLVSQLTLGRTFILFRRTQAAIEREEIQKQINEGEDVEAEKVVAPTFKERLTELMGLSLALLPYTILFYLINCPFLELGAWARELLLNQPSVARTCAVGFGALALFILIIFFATTLLYPLFHTAMTVKNDREEKKKISFKDDIKIGFRHKGKLFTVAFLSSFIAAILSIIPSLPLIVSASAISNSLTSALLHNDNAVIPSSGMWLMFLACALSAAIINFISMISASSLLYIYGSICEHEKEKTNK